MGPPRQVESESIIIERRRAVSGRLELMRRCIGGMPAFPERPRLIVGALSRFIGRFLRPIPLWKNAFDGLFGRRSERRTNVGQFQFGESSLLRRSEWAVQEESKTPGRQFEWGKCFTCTN